MAKAKTVNKKAKPLFQLPSGKATKNQIRKSHATKRINIRYVQAIYNGLDRSNFTPVLAIRPGFWRTSDDRYIPLSSLSNRHILSAIRVLARKSLYSEALSEEINVRVAQAKQASPNRVPDHIRANKSKRKIGQRKLIRL